MEKNEEFFNFCKNVFSKRKPQNLNIACTLTHCVLLLPVKPPNLQDPLKTQSPVLEGQTFNSICNICGYFYTINHPVYS